MTTERRYTPEEMREMAVTMDSVSGPTIAQCECAAAMLRQAADLMEGERVLRVIRRQAAEDAGFGAWDASVDRIHQELAGEVPLPEERDR